MAYTRTVIKKVKARFIEPMLLLKTDALPDHGERWAYQLKVDGYRAIAFKRRKASPAVAERQRFHDPVSRHV